MKCNVRHCPARIHIHNLGRGPQYRADIQRGGVLRTLGMELDCEGGQWVLEEQGDDHDDDDGDDDVHGKEEQIKLGVRVSKKTLYNVHTHQGSKNIF